MLLDLVQNDQARAHLLAVSCAKSGEWLNTLPIAPLGLRLSDDVVRVAIGLRLGVFPSVDLIFMPAVVQMLRHGVFMV